MFLLHISVSIHVICSICISCAPICHVLLSLYTSCANYYSRPCVQVVSSTRSGMGKSLYVRRMAEAIRGSKIVCIPVHGPDVTSDAIMGLLNDVGDSHCTLFHFDVAPNVRSRAAVLYEFHSLASTTTYRSYIK